MIAIADSSREEESAIITHRHDEGCKPKMQGSLSDDKTKYTSATSSTSHPNSVEATSSRPSCEPTSRSSSSSSHHPRDNNDNKNNVGLVKPRISQIQQRIEVLSAASLASDDHISPLSATSVADGMRKDNNCFIRTIPIGIAKSNKREYILAQSGARRIGGDKTGILSYTYSC